MLSCMLPICRENIQSPMDRPEGVTAIARLFFAVAAYLCAVGLIMLLSPGSVSMAAGADPAEVPENRNCLVNVDAYGMPIPSSRFMGGREIEILTGIDTRRIDIVPDQPALLAATGNVLWSDERVLPTFSPGFGPFPDASGRWVGDTDNQYDRRAAVCLYAAMVANVSLDLIGARERILVEGRFAEAQVFVRAPTVERILG